MYFDIVMLNKETMVMVLYEGQSLLLISRREEKVKNLFFYEEVRKEKFFANLVFMTTDKAISGDILLWI